MKGLGESEPMVFSVVRRSTTGTMGPMRIRFPQGDAQKRQEQTSSDKLK